MLGINTAQSRDPIFWPLPVPTLHDILRDGLDFVLLRQLIIVGAIGGLGAARARGPFLRHFRVFPIWVAVRPNGCLRPVGAAAVL